MALFNKKQVSDDERLQRIEEYTYEYMRSDDINFTAIFANKLANYAISDSTIDVIGNNLRAELLNEVLERLKKQLKKTVSKDLGVGGVLVIPYVANNKIYFNIITQNRFSINKKVGEDIVDCTVMAEMLTINNDRYFRWADYTLKNGNLYIKYRATNEDTPINITSIPEWSDIKDMSITGVRKMPFMYIKSPVDNRIENNDYGVPITFGCEEQIRKIKHTLDQIEREFDLKETFIGADITMFNGENALPTDGIYKKINSGEDDFWEVFDPDYRDEPLFRKLEKECSMLEKQVGISKGILTDVETANATATEIKKMLKDTFDFVDDVRTSLEDGLNDFIYACDVLANYYNLTPPGDYELVIDWSYDLLEDNSATFSQLIQGVNQGVIKKSELRQFLRPSETLEEAQKAIEEIKAQNPTTKDLIGE